MKKIFGYVLVLLLVGCAAPPQWNWFKPNSTEADFHSTKYSCLQKAQQPYSSSYGYNSGGIVSSLAMTTQSSSAGIATNMELFDACMYSNGWKKQYTQNTVSSKINSVKMSIKEAQDTCQRQGYKNGTYPFDECVKSRMGGK